MKKIHIIGLAAVIMLIMNSCLKKDLPEYENWDLNNIDNVYVEYRYESDKILNDKPVIAYQRLNVQKNVVENTNTIELTIDVPQASGTFTNEIRNKIVQNYLWMYMDISTAAKVIAVGDAPKLGDPIDLTKDWQYQVIAANGNTKTWIIKVVSFNK
ncbi:DUF5018-related domain-containing protein [Sphingobacterium sp. ML3W]|uniref:DUF5018-related domain-containing protein n=1 Tax=Sphingobacterium sp. ML3W TaxID=1538644 RepID=UPI001185C2CA|nr:hypothetical protein [Sphingobacterium sp. ML3W]